MAKQQTKPTAKKVALKPVSKTTTTIGRLKTLRDSSDYEAGKANVASSYMIKQKVGGKEFNQKDFRSALDDKSKNLGNMRKYQKMIDVGLTKAKATPKKK